MRPRPGNIVERGILATAAEKKNGWRDGTIDKFFRESLTPFEYWGEAIRRAGERERLCSERVHDFKVAHDGDDLTVAAKKELAALELDLQAAVDARRRAASALSEVAA